MHFPNKPNHFSMLLLCILWVGLFIWRKTFAYIEIVGIYIIEAVSFMVIILFLLGTIIEQGGQLRLKIVNSKFQHFYISIFLFLMFTVIRILLSESINPKALIPAVYFIYFIIFLVFSLNTNYRELKKFLIISKFLFFIPAFSFFIIEISKPFFGSPETPGQTFIYGVSLGLALILNDIRLRIITIASIGIFVILLAERAAFLNAIFAYGLLLILDKRNFWNKINTTISTIITSVGLIILFGPFMFNLVFGDIFSRFELSSINLLKFLGSIFINFEELGGDMSGTRSHRLEMWFEIIEIVSSNPLNLLFGMGFHGEVLDILGVSFRAPHNGFVTLYYRLGIVGVVLFLNVLLSLFIIIKRQFTSQKDIYTSLNVLLYGAFIGDILTGTIIDSPFTLFIFIALTSILIAYNHFNEKMAYST